MDRSPLVSDWIDAGLDLAQRFDQYRPVMAAFWLCDADGDWNLYLTSKDIHDGEVGAAYREIGRLVREKWDSNVDSMKLKVVDVDSPLARAMADFLQEFPHRPSPWIGGGRFGNKWAEEIYLYPTPLPGKSAIEPTASRSA